MHPTVFTPHVTTTQAKWAFTTRRVRRTDVAGLQADVSTAVSGDLVLAEVIEIGQHKRIQLHTGRHSQFYPGDPVVLACGDRYAPDQFEGVARLDPDGADLIAGGGILGQMQQWHERMSPPTQLKPLGLLTDSQGITINTSRYALPPATMPTGVAVLGVVGASMNAGKTTAAVSLAHGLSKAGLRVAGIKVTGTGAFGDYNAFRDAGIEVVADFTDAGMASTYRQPLEKIARGFESLVAHAVANGADIVVAELADGIFQHETAAFLRSPTGRRGLAGVLYAATDAMSAVGGVNHLRKMGYKPFAVSGVVSRSPLAAAEAHGETAVPVATRDELRDPARALCLTEGVLPQQLADTRQVA